MPSPVAAKLSCKTATNSGPNLHSLMAAASTPPKLPWQRRQQLWREFWNFCIIEEYPPTDVDALNDHGNLIELDTTPIRYELILAICDSSSLLVFSAPISTTRLQGSIQEIASIGCVGNVLLDTPTRNYFKIWLLPCGILLVLLLHLYSRQQLGSSTKVHIALGFLILALLTALQVKYQNSGNPFQTHGAIMSSFIVLVIGYALTLAGISQPTLNTSYLHIGRRMCIILGTSASGLLVEVLLPLWGILILILAISALMFAQLLCVSHQQILQCFVQIFQSINQSISEAVKTLCGWVQNGF
ncbi:uncharacterized protein LOC126691431 [Quercus robur]|uniref:uncharacterized protein LOC126691431 n=1 Tax=Quercus robur TaxID=38942 RepID=UPI00216264EC|nr:uncharacterized protein LOC126691431 [Quercus robur]